jgi:hypothetical protein
MATDLKDSRLYYLGFDIEGEDVFIQNKEIEK